MNLFTIFYLPAPKKKRKTPPRSGRRRREKVKRFHVDELFHSLRNYL
jgi:hypothetical protein